MHLQTSNHKYHTCRISEWRGTISSWLIFEWDLWHVHLSRKEVQLAASSSPTSLKTGKGKKNLLIHLLATQWVESPFNLSDIFRILFLTEFECRFPKYCLKGKAKPRAFKFRNFTFTRLYFTQEAACDLFTSFIIVCPPNTSVTKSTKNRT